MCNLYSVTTNVEAIRQLFKVERIDPSAGNMPALPGIFPGQNGPVIRADECGDRELTMMHWGFILKQAGKAPKPVTNARDDKLQTFFWKWSFAERRCLIPASSFAEYHPTERNEKGHKIVVWFGLRGEEPRTPFAFAGLWRTWKGEYRGNETELECYTIVTTKPNTLVKPIHPTRMPVILDPTDHEKWMSGSQDQALALTRPFNADRMQIVYEGGKSDDEQSAKTPPLWP